MQTTTNIKKQSDQVDHTWEAITFPLSRRTLLKATTHIPVVAGREARIGEFGEVAAKVSCLGVVLVECAEDTGADEVVCMGGKIEMIRRNPSTKKLF